MAGILYLFKYLLVGGGGPGKTYLVKYGKIKCERCMYLLGLLDFLDLHIFNG